MKPIRSTLRTIIYKRKIAVIGKDCRFYGKCDISGKGRIVIGNNVTVIKAKLSAGPGAMIVIGNNCYVDNCGLTALGSIEIGEETFIAGNASLQDTDWHGTRRSECGKIKPIIVGKHVWICAGASVLKGVSIGDNAIIGLGSIVTHDVAPNTIVAGNPAKKIGETDGYGLFATFSTIDLNLTNGKVCNK